MSWEIQGEVESAADVDALFDSPTEPPAAAEDGQTDAVSAAVKALLDANVVEGPLYVRAGGHANEGATVDGQPREMITLTIDCAPPPVEVDEPADEAAPTWGDAKTNTPEQVAANDAATAEPTWGDAKTAEAPSE